MPSTLKISKKTSTNSFKQDQELALKPTMVLVLGMHRSGTSVTARLLECLGAKNSDILMRPSEGNPEGYFEDQDIYEFNERKLLPRLGRAWHSVGSVDWTALSAADRGKYALEALEIVRKNYFLSNPLSVLKEPRVCILLPFWLSVFQHAGFNVKVVCVVRDPVSVVRSLSKAQGLSLTHSGILFVNYWISVLNYIQDLPVAFVQYDEIFVNPAKSLRDVAQKLSLPYPKDFEERVHAFSSSFFDKKLRHSTLQSCDLALETDLPPLAIELYESLLAGAQAQNVKKTAKFVEHSRKWLQSLQPAFLEFDRLFAQFHGANHRTHELQAALDSERSSGYRDQLAGLQGEKERLEQELARAQAEVAQQSGQHAAIAGEAEGLRQQLGEVTRRVEALQQEAGGYREQLAGLEQLGAEGAAEIERLNAEVAKVNAEKQALEGRIAEGEAQSAARISQLEQLGVERAVEIERLHGEIANAQANSRERFEELAKLTRMLVDAQSDRDRCASENSELAARFEDFKAETAEAEAQSTARIAHLEQEGTTSAAEIERLNGELQNAKTNIRERFEELAKLTRLYIDAEENGKKLAAAWRQQSTPTVFGEATLVGKAEDGEFQHIEYSLKDIQHLGRQFRGIQARIINHRGDVGIVIFEPDASERAFYGWEKTGEENGRSYMLIIPKHTAGREALFAATTNDLLLIKAIVLEIAVQLAQNSEEKDSFWLETCQSILDEFEALPTRLHYDDVKVASKQGNSTEVKIVNPSWNNRLISMDTISFSGKKIMAILDQKGRPIPDRKQASRYLKEIFDAYQKETKNLLFHIFKEQ